MITESIIHTHVKLQPYTDIAMERIHAHAKHSATGTSMETVLFTDAAWLPVLTEELGEVAKELCDFRHTKEADRNLIKHAAHLRAELIQVAAMAAAWADACTAYINNPLLIWEREGANERTGA